MSPHRALGACVGFLLLVSVAGCVTPAIANDVAPAAMAWATSDKLEVQFQAPETFTSVHFVRHGDTASIGTGTGVLRPVGSDAREIMVQEALDGPLASGRDVIACYEISPPLRFAEDSPWEATALMVVEIDGRPAVLVRGPLGWARPYVSEFEHNEPSAVKAVVAAGGVSLLVVGGVCADGVIGALIGAGVLAVGWLLAGCPGLAYAVTASQHHRH
jgi:hypothetical protein